MADQKPKEIGSIAWQDLTAPEAAKVRDFYASVVGWRAENVDMGGYSDYNMCAPGSGTAAAGICHARGTNAGLPAQWLIYIVVEDVEAAAARCEASGGTVRVKPKSLGAGRYCVIEDPAGAVCALYQARG